MVEVGFPFENLRRLLETFENAKKQGKLRDILRKTVG
jgi:hypothetical protein